MAEFDTAVGLGAGTPPPGYEYLCMKLKERSGIDLSAYRSRQMMRRLTSYLQRLQLPSFFALAKLIERDDAALEKLKDYLTINVTEFFRNPERYLDLERRVLPELLRRFPDLSIWSAGCSTGPEPYSLAILLEELAPQSRHRILGTDIDQRALDEAAKGVYAADKLREVSPERRRFFRETGDGRFEVAPELKRRVELRRHDLLADPYPQGMHLILCRNVIIYFTEEAKERVWRGFAGALAPGGYLMIGSTESIFNAGEYGLSPVGPFLYQKPAGVVS